MAFEAENSCIDPQKTDEVLKLMRPDTRHGYNTLNIGKNLCNSQESPAQRCLLKQYSWTFLSKNVKIINTRPQVSGTSTHHWTQCFNSCKKAPTSTTRASGHPNSTSRASAPTRKPSTSISEAPASSPFSSNPSSRKVMAKFVSSTSKQDSLTSNGSSPQRLTQLQVGTDNGEVPDLEPHDESNRCERHPSPKRMRNQDQAGTQVTMNTNVSKGKVSADLVKGNNFNFSNCQVTINYNFGRKKRRASLCFCLSKCHCEKVFSPVGQSHF